MKSIIRRIMYFVVSFFFMGCLGCNAPRVETGAQGKMGLGPQSNRARGAQRVLMVAVRFPGIRSTYSIEEIQNKVVDDFNQYVKEQSYGLTWIEADFRGWVTLPDPLSEYRVKPYNFQVSRSRIRKLIEDTMTAVEDEVDFSAYEHMLVIPGVFTRPGRGYGMLCYCANPGMLTGVRHQPGYVRLRSKNGESFQGGVFVGAENAHLGMFAHDFFHALGGVHKGKRLAP